MKKIAKKKPRPLSAYYAAMVPTSWLDPLLSGDDEVIGMSPYTEEDIERLLRAVAKRIRDSAGPQESKP